jgi:hypothetical protein
MQFFLLDFALAFVALLGYRAMAAVAQARFPAVSLQGSPLPSPSVAVTPELPGRAGASGRNPF